MYNTLSDNPALATLPEKRIATVSYLRTELRMKFKSIVDQIDVCFVARCKSYAISAGKLEPVFCELELGAKLHIPPSQ